VSVVNKEPRMMTIDDVLEELDELTSSAKDAHESMECAETCEALRDVRANLVDARDASTELVKAITNLLSRMGSE